MWGTPTPPSVNAGSWCLQSKGTTGGSGSQRRLRASAAVCKTGTTTDPIGLLRCHRDAWTLSISQRVELLRGVRPRTDVQIRGTPGTPMHATRGALWSSVLAAHQNHMGAQNPATPGGPCLRMPPSTGVALPARRQSRGTAKT